MNEQTPAKVVTRAGAQVAPLVPTTIEETWQLSKYFSMSGVVPKSFPGDRGSDENTAAVLGAIQMGATVGLFPIQALASIMIVNGKFALYGDGQLAVVRRAGVLAKFEEVIENLPPAGTPKKDWPADVKAVCRVWRADDPAVIAMKNGQWPEPTSVGEFSVGDAVVGGLWGKSGPWQSFPARMLRYRARSFSLRDGCPDVLLGLAHSVEELIDEPILVDGGDLVRGADGSYSAMFNADAAPVSEPAPPDETDPNDDGEDAAERAAPRPSAPAPAEAKAEEPNKAAPASKTEEKAPAKKAPPPPPVAKNDDEKKLSERAAVVPPPPAAKEPAKSKTEQVSAEQKAANARALNNAVAEAEARLDDKKKPVSSDAPDEDEKKAENPAVPDGQGEDMDIPAFLRRDKNAKPNGAVAESPPDESGPDPDDDAPTDEPPPDPEPEPEPEPKPKPEISEEDRKKIAQIKQSGYARKLVEWMVPAMKGKNTLDDYHVFMNRYTPFLDELRVHWPGLAKDVEKANEEILDKFAVAASGV